MGEQKRKRAYVPAFFYFCVGIILMFVGIQIGADEHIAWAVTARQMVQAVFHQIDTWTTAIGPVVAYVVIAMCIIFGLAFVAVAAYCAFWGEKVVKKSTVDYDDPMGRQII